MIDFKEVESQFDLRKIEQLAVFIWNEHYTPIIGKPQVEYMLEKFQSVDAMLTQINNGYRYFLIGEDEFELGYLSFERRETALFLSKIYLLKKHRGKGIGKQAMEFITSAARGMGCSKVTLTVNRFNQYSIKAYKRAGFQIKGELVQDIGNGFVMDDYLMEKEV